MVSRNQGRGPSVNIIDWLRETARYMRADRPDLYESEEEALEDLSQIYHSLGDYDYPCWSAWAGFFLHKWTEDGLTEWTFTKKISEAAVFPEEGKIKVYGWTASSGTLKTGVNLPSPDFEEGEE